MATWDLRRTRMQLFYTFDNVTNMTKQYGRLQARLARSNLDSKFLVGLRTTTGTDVRKLKSRLAKDDQCRFFRFARVHRLWRRKPYELSHAGPMKSTAKAD